MACQHFFVRCGIIAISDEFVLKTKTINQLQFGGRQAVRERTVGRVT
jgi:hypothetical protein